MEETTDIESQGVPEITQAEQQEPQYYQFRFMGQPVKILSEYIDTYDILVLSLIEIHGWWYYENLKVNYNYTLPSPDLEHIVNFKCMEREVNGKN